MDKICFKSKEITKSKLTTKVTDKKRKQRPTEYDILRAWRLNVSRWVIQLPINRVDTVKNCFTKMIVFSVLSLFFISIRTCFRALMCVCALLWNGDILHLPLVVSWVDSYQRHLNLIARKPSFKKEFQTTVSNIF